MRRRKEPAKDIGGFCSIKLAILNGFDRAYRGISKRYTVDSPDPIEDALPEIRRRCEQVIVIWALVWCCQQVVVT